VIPPGDPVPEFTYQGQTYKTRPERGCWALPSSTATPCLAKSSPVWTSSTASQGLLTGGGGPSRPMCPRRPSIVINTLVN
jgi:hypothetical protein